MKAAYLISAVLFIAITLSIMAIVYQTGVPILQRMQDAATIEKMRTALSQADTLVVQVASEGNGSRRIIDLRTDPGRLGIDPVNNALYWQIETRAFILPGRSAQYFGNLIFGSHLSSQAYNDTYKGSDSLVLENEHLTVYFRKIGSPQNPQAYSTNQLLLGAYMKNLQEWLPLQELDISMDGNPSSKSGTGYTILEREGAYLPYGRVIAVMNSSYANYTLSFTLESGADFLRIDAA